MGKHGIDDLVYSKAREVVYEQMKWTETENTFRSMIEKGDLTLSNCLAKTVRKSTTGEVVAESAEDRESVTLWRWYRDALELVEKAKRVPKILTMADAFNLLTVLRLGYNRH